MGLFSGGNAADSPMFKKQTAGVLEQLKNQMAIAEPVYDKQDQKLSDSVRAHIRQRMDGKYGPTPQEVEMQNAKILETARMVANQRQKEAQRQLFSRGISGAGIGGVDMGGDALARQLIANKIGALQQRQRGQAASQEMMANYLGTKAGVGFQNAQSQAYIDQLRQQQAAQNRAIIGSLLGSGGAIAGNYLGKKFDQRNQPQMQQQPSVVQPPIEQFGQPQQSSFSQNNWSFA